MKKWELRIDKLKRAKKNILQSRKTIEKSRLNAKIYPN